MTLSQTGFAQVETSKKKDYPYLASTISESYFNIFT